jgi:saccharopine dehydrogenase-like NADP-dependent oxidoreductase
VRLPDAIALQDHFFLSEKSQYQGHCQVQKTCTGDLAKGTKDGQPREMFIYNVADHEEAFAETDSQGISYTAGVPPVAAALLVARGEWDVKRMVNVEELPAQAFLKALDVMGLPTRIKDENGDRPWDE